MRLSPQKAGALQAAGLALYVGLFATMVWWLPQASGLKDTQVHQVLATSLFLLVFVTSASICGSIMFGYPTLLFLEQKKKEAAETVLWSIFWLIVCAALVLSAILLFTSPSPATVPSGA